MKYSTEAHAKINLYLDVKEKHPDGYHEIESIMQQVSLSDTITLTLNDHAGENRIKITCDDPAIPTDRRNIVWKCAEKFFDHFGIGKYDIEIGITKRIPSSAGLAGGSSDGAAVLKLLDKAFACSASTDKLCAIGAKVGADIPFCIVGKACICRGIGEILTPIALPIQNYSIIVAFPGGGVSTPEAYALLDKTPNDGVQRNPDDILGEIKSGKTPTSLYNAFERAILPVHDGATALRGSMLSLGAVSSLMSGSGPSVYGIFDDDTAFENAFSTLEKCGYRVHRCRPIY